MRTRLGRALGGPFPLGWAIVVGMLALLLGGCSRAHYRRQADREVYGLVDQTACDPRWELEDFTIQPDSRSRLFDPFCPDRPPMPPDDPTSHRLMHCVDCKRGWPCWHHNGDADGVENAQWRFYLPMDDQGRVTLNRNGAVELARLHSREYQRSLENLYLAALDVTYERFRFDVQFFGSNVTTYTADGRIRGPGVTQQTLENDSSLTMKKLFAPGGQLVVELANQLVWQFAGPDGTNANTLLSFGLTQKLLREGGRAVVMENLTQKERALVANVRQMENFRQGFYAQIVAGRGAINGPSGSAIAIGALAPGGPVVAGGFLGLLEEQVRIRNERANLAALQESWEKLLALSEAGRIEPYQAQLARQSLYNSQTRLLSSLAAYEDRLDGYKITVGLPPDVQMLIDDPLLDQFDLIVPAMRAAQDSVTALLKKTQNPAQPMPADYQDQIAKVLQDSREQLAVVDRDVKKLGEVLPERQEDLQRLSGRPELQRGEVDPSAYNVDALNRRVQGVNDDFAKRLEETNSTFAELEAWQKSTAGKNAQAMDGETRGKLGILLTTLSGRLLKVSLIQARARLESIRLVQVDLDPAEAIQIARDNRLDWMNARAAVVDVWRQIEIRANYLRSVLNYTFSGNLNNRDNNPLNLNTTTGQLRVGLQFDPPLTRLEERNLYRESLINYQRTRRDYLLFTDRVYQGLRSTLRTIRVSQLDFEIRRAAVGLAIDQVDVTRLRLEEPPRNIEIAPFRATIARDLVTALAELLSVENNLVGAWGDYEALRMTLDYDLGTMQLDSRGIWVDPGPLRFNKSGTSRNSPTGDLRVAYPEPAPEDPALDRPADHPIPVVS